jgi:hypothetical protein
MNTRMEALVNEMVTRTIEAVIATKLPEIEEAAQRAIERGLERALSGRESAPVAAASPVPGVRRVSSPAAKRRADEARAAAARAPAPANKAPAPVNVVRIPPRQPPRKVEQVPYRRSPSEVEQMTIALLHQIAETPGMTSEGLVEQLGAKGIEASTREIRLPLRKLLMHRQVQTRGDKRFTRYYPVPIRAARRPPSPETGVRAVASVA